MPEISRHALLEYCSLAKLSRSRLSSLSDSLELSLDVIRLDSSLVNLPLGSSKLFLKLSRMESNLPW